jgi:thiol-disulfide isomerase/thioredoxin
MSTEKKKHPGPLTQIAAGFVILAAITGYYLFQADPRKAGPAETAAETPAAAASAAASGVTRALATGTLAAFLVHPEPKPLPDVAFTDGEGKPLKLSDWKGRVVLINLWATWCAPCRKEMPDLAALQKELGSDQFEVVAISVDRKGAEASSAFLKETGAGNLKLYVEPTTKIVGELQSAGLPATILIDRQGREVGRLLGPAHWAAPEAIALVKAALSAPE